MRLNYGPYEREGSNVSVKKTRLQFLWNAKARVPEITADLFSTCYPIYYKFLITYLKKLLRSPYYKEQASTSAEWLLNHAPEWEEIKSSRQTVKLLNSLDDWSKRHNLDAEWCRQWATSAMKSWVADKEARSSLSWCKSPELVRYILIPEFYPQLSFDYERLSYLRWLVGQLGVVDFGPDGEPSPKETESGEELVVLPTDYVKYKDRLAPSPPQGIPRWLFTATSREEYLQSVDCVAREEIRKSALLSSVELSHQEEYVREVKRVAAVYCDSVEEFLSKQRGWKKSKVYPDHRAHLKHVIWAVMFQVEGKSYSDIANEMQVAIKELPTVSTVKRAVSGILDLISLDTDRRQEVRRGPKRGSKHSASKKASRDVLRSLGK